MKTALEVHDFCKLHLTDNRYSNGRNSIYNYYYNWIFYHDFPNQIRLKYDFAVYLRILITKDPFSAKEEIEDLKVLYNYMES